MHKIVLTASGLLLGLTTVFSPSLAISSPNDSIPAMYSAKKMQSGMAGHRHQKGHPTHNRHRRHGTRLLSPHWKQTLTKEQKIQIDQMHLELAKVKMTLKAKIKALKTELVLLSTADSPSRVAIENKIEELLAVKRNMMRIRYEHIANLRKVLNSQQRVSFDLDVLNRAAQGKSKHH